MNELIQQTIWSKISETILFGRRWLLLIPFVIIPVLYAGIKAFFNLSDFRTTLTNPYFIIFSVATTLICIFMYIFLASRPAPKDRIVIAVLKFYPVTEDDKKEAVSLQHRVIEAINQRMLEFEIKGSAKPLSETIDPQSERGAEKTIWLGKQYQAHLVVGGSVRVDEEYYFRPQIFNLSAGPNLFSPRNSKDTAEDFTVPKRQSLALKKQIVADVTDLAVFICGLTKVYGTKFEEAVNILNSIKDPSPEAMFYHGFSLLQLDRKQEALALFEEVLKDKPDFLFATIYAGIAAEELGNSQKALDYYQKANEIAQGKPVDLFHKDLYVALDWVERKLRRTQRSVEIMQTAIGNIETASNDHLRDLEAVKLNAEGEDILNSNAASMQEALEKFEAAVRVSPKYAAAWANKGLMLAKLKKVKQAEDALSKAEEYDADAFLLARAYAVLGYMELMLQKLEIAVKQDKSHKFEARIIYKEFMPFQSNEKFVKLVRGD